MRRTLQVIPLGTLVEARRAGAVPGHTFPVASRTESWLVLASPVRPDGSADWARVVGSDYVNVPVHRYFTVPDPATTVAFAASIGTLAIAACGPRAADALRMHLVYADTVEDVRDPGGNPAFAIYLGLALQVNE